MPAEECVGQDRLPLGQETAQHAWICAGVQAEIHGVRGESGLAGEQAERVVALGVASRQSGVLDLREISSSQPGAIRHTTTWLRGAMTYDSAVKKDEPARARAVVRGLRSLYPQAMTALRWEDPFRLLVATILSAQCTDVRVNLVTPALFRRFPDARAMARAEPAEIEELIRSTGFFRNKAKHILGAARAIVERHGGGVPRSMEDLLALPGVARKTANCVLGSAFGTSEGVVVDTHVGRIARRMGFTRQADPVKVERDLMGAFPREDWIFLSHAWIEHGRAVCTARKARCAECGLAEVCPRRGVDG